MALIESGYYFIFIICTCYKLFENVLFSKEYKCTKKLRSGNLYIWKIYNLHIKNYLSLTNLIKKP